MSDSRSYALQRVGSFQLALLVFTVLLLAGLLAASVLSLPKQMSNLIHIIDTFGCAVFFADFCYRFNEAESKLAFLRWGWIDLLACVPTVRFLRWGRLVRVFRVFRVLRGVRSFQLILQAVFQDKLRGGVVSVVFSALLLVAFSSAAVLVFERRPGGNIKTAGDAVWWSLSTITTVGYGDRYPVTAEGRIIGIILMVAGVSMFGCLSGMAATFFLGERRDKPSELAAVLARLDQLQAKVDALAQKSEAGPKGPPRLSV